MFSKFHWSFERHQNLLAPRPLGGLNAEYNRVSLGKLNCKKFLVEKVPSSERVIEVFRLSLLANCGSLCADKKKESNFSKIQY